MQIFDAANLMQEKCTSFAHVPHLVVGGYGKRNGANVDTDSYSSDMWMCVTF